MCFAGRERANSHSLAHCKISPLDINYHIALRISALSVPIPVGLLPWAPKRSLLFTVHNQHNGYQLQCVFCASASIRYRGDSVGHKGPRWGCRQSVRGAPGPQHTCVRCPQHVFGTCSAAPPGILGEEMVMHTRGRHSAEEQVGAPARQPR